MSKLSPQKRSRNTDWRPIELCRLHLGKSREHEHWFSNLLATRLDGIAAAELTMFCGCRYLDLEAWYLRRWDEAMKATPKYQVHDNGRLTPIRNGR